METRRMANNNLARRPLHSPTGSESSCRSPEMPEDEVTSLPDINESSDSPADMDLDISSPTKQSNSPQMNLSTSSKERQSISPKGKQSISPKGKQSISPKGKQSTSPKKLYPSLDEEMSDSPKVPKTHKTSSKGTTYKKSYIEELKYWIVGVIVVLLGICLVLIVTPKEDPPHIENTTKAVKVINELQHQFSNQLNISMKIIRKSLGKVINEASQPKCPSILLLVSSMGAEKTANIFADKLASLVYQDKNFPCVEGGNFKNTDPDKSKEVLDFEIEEYVGTEKANVIVIKDIDMIPGKTATIFYKYCDHENAPYKKLVIILTVSGEKQITKEANSTTMDSIARERLWKSWSDLGRDQFDPLFARLGVSVTGIL